jgi:hypothetical protein
LLYAYSISSASSLAFIAHYFSAFLCLHRPT